MCPWTDSNPIPDYKQNVNDKYHQPDTSERILERALHNTMLFFSVVVGVSTAAVRPSRKCGALGFGSGTYNVIYDGIFRCAVHATNQSGEKTRKSCNRMRRTNGMNEWQGEKGSEYFPGQHRMRERERTLLTHDIYHRLSGVCTCVFVCVFVYFV